MRGLKEPGTVHLGSRVRKCRVRGTVHLVGQPVWNTGVVCPVPPVTPDLAPHPPTPSPRVQGEGELFFFRPDKLPIRPPPSAASGWGRIGRVIGDSVIGDSVIGDSVIGDSVIGDSVIGDVRVIGDSALGWDSECGHRRGVGAPGDVGVPPVTPPFIDLAPFSRRYSGEKGWG